MIKPTVGRVVWYWPSGKAEKELGAQPLAAQIAFVHDDHCINIGYLDRNGFAYAATSVPLVQEGDEMIPTGPFCEWMPYQKAVASGQQAPTLHA